ncbi:MAG: sensor histidine kinase, partial [Dehalococcoidales bacterium]|nr:sensor histidine kinase [Dehalococcoidales bacterium]
EEERKRVSRELHDDTAQSLAIIKMEIESLLTSGEIQSEKMLTRLSQLRDNVDRAIQDIRRYSHELRPGILDYFGLEDALEQMAAEIAERIGLDIQFDITGEVRRLTEDVELALFRIAQEAVNNICKHAEATSAVIGLTYYPDKVRMVIADNGKGFAVKLKNGTPRIRGSLGLLGMRERAHLIGADLNIESSPGRGTRVSVEVRC